MTNATILETLSACTTKRCGDDARCLAVLVALSLTLLTAYFGESSSGGLHSVQRGAMEVLAPIQEGANRVVKPFRDLFGWFGSTLDAKDERDKLKKERDALRQEVTAAPGRRRREQAAALAARHQHGRRHEGLRAGDRARLRALPEHLVLDRRDQQGLERRRARRPARDQRRGPGRQGQVRLGRQRDRDAADRPGVRRLGEGRALGRAGLARPRRRRAGRPAARARPARQARQARASASSPPARSRRG